MLYHDETPYYYAKMSKKHFGVWFSGVRRVVKEWFDWKGGDITSPIHPKVLSFVFRNFSAPSRRKIALIRVPKG